MVQQDKKTIKKIFKKLMALEKEFTPDEIRFACNKYNNKIKEQAKITKEIEDIVQRKKQLEESLEDYK